MRKLFYILIAVLLFHNFIFGQWVQQTNPAGLTNLYDIQFINENTGWAVGINSTIIKTIDGGNNWFIQPNNLTANKNLHGPSMIDTNTGFIVGWFETILKTTNGGSNWIILSDGPVGQGNSWNSSSFINSQTGWICGFLGVVKRTTNGGSTWDSLNAGGTLREIQFLNSQTGWVAGDGGRIRKTTDGGNTWQFQFQGTNADYLNNSMHFININTGWIVGYRSFVFRTTNSGVNWDTLASLNGEAIRFTNEMTGWCGGSLINTNAAVMYKTIDGGFNWYQQTLPFASAYCGSIWANNNSTVWATYARFIIHTTNGGGNYIGIQPITNSYPEKYELIQNYPNPFNPKTNIEFSLPKLTFVKFVIFDILGREIDILINNELKAGKYKLEWNADSNPNGIYFCSLITNNIILTRKMMLIK